MLVAVRLLLLMFSRLSSVLSLLLPASLGSDDADVQRGLEWQLEQADDWLQLVDDLGLYMGEVEDHESVVEALAQELAATDEDSMEWDGHWDLWEKALQESEDELDAARRDLHRLQTDRERFVEQRRHQLTVEVQSMHRELTRLFPQWQWKRTVVSQPVSVSTPSTHPGDNAAASTTLPSSLRHRRLRTQSHASIAN